MKKGLLALLLALLALTTLPAVAYELEGEGAVVTEETVGLPVTLDISSGSGTAETYIDIGFSQETSLTSKMTPSYNPATASEVTLIGSAGTGMLNPNEELYVYWVVMSLTGPLHGPILRQRLRNQLEMGHTTRQERSSLTELVIILLVHTMLFLSRLIQQITQGRQLVSIPEN